MAKALTATSVEKLLADPSKRREIPDGLLAGLYLVVQPSGKKSWAVRYRSGGATRKLTLGTYPALDLSAARAAARAALTDAQKGADPAAEKQQARRDAKESRGADRDSFPAVARLFIERHAKPNTRTWLGTARLLGLAPDKDRPEEGESPKAFVIAKGGIAERWETKRVQDITRRDIIGLLDDIVESGRPVGANRSLAAIRKMFNWAAGRDIIAANPVAGVKAPSAETSRDRVLSDDELCALWKASDMVGWPMGNFVQLLILTGQRRDEVAGMRKSELHLGKALWTIPRERAKNDVAHDVPLSGAVTASLSAFPVVANPKGLVFTTTSETPISGFSKTKAKLDEHMLSILKEAAVERGESPNEVVLAPWRLHDIRRTAATGMARLGVSLPVVEKVLNHVSGSFAGIVGVYQRHSFADEKRKALEAWGEHVTRLIRAGDKP